MSLRVSVCLPVFNGQEFLQEALNSILNQTISDIEVIVTDDCSSDASAEIVRAIAEQDKRVKYWRNETQLGLFANYNQSFDHAQGRYIKPMAQDDILMPDVLEKFLEQFQRNPELSLVSCDRHVIDDEGEIVEVYERVTPTSVLGKKDVYSLLEVTRASLMPIRNLVGEPCTVMFKTEDLDGGFSPRLKHTGDIEFWIKLLRKGDFRFVSEKLASFRQHRKSASVYNISELHVAVDVIEMADLCREELTECGVSEKDFILCNLSDLSVTIVDQFSKGGITDQSLGGGASSREEEVFALRKALLHSFLLMQEGAMRKLEEREAEWAVKNAERRLSAILRSTPWRATAFIRKINSIVNPGKESEPLEEKEPSSKEVKFDSSKAYLSYLREEQRKILKSRTWKLGRSIISRLGVRC